jgi:hypothetical protein
MDRLSISAAPRSSVHNQSLAATAAIPSGSKPQASVNRARWADSEAAPRPWVDPEFADHFSWSTYPGGAYALHSVCGRRSLCRPPEKEICPHVFCADGLNRALESLIKPGQAQARPHGSQLAGYMWPYPQITLFDSALSPSTAVNHGRPKRPFVNRRSSVNRLTGLPSGDGGGKIWLFPFIAKGLSRPRVRPAHRAARASASRRECDTRVPPCCL